MSNNVEMMESVSMDESLKNIQQQKEDDENHHKCIDELRTIFLQVHNYQQEPDKYVSFLVYLFE